MQTPSPTRRSLVPPPVVKSIPHADEVRGMLTTANKRRLRDAVRNERKQMASRIYDAVNSRLKYMGGDDADEAFGLLQFGIYPENVDSFLRAVKTSGWVADVSVTLQGISPVKVDGAEGFDRLENVKCPTRGGVYMCLPEDVSQINAMRFDFE